MPISKIQAYSASDGRIGTLEEVQRWELELALFPQGPTELANSLVSFQPTEHAPNVDRLLLDAVVNSIFAASDRIVEVLTTGPRSRPKARKQAGTTSPKQAARVARSKPASQPTTNKQESAV